MGIVAVSFESAPERWTEMPDITDEVWPEYSKHGDVLNRYWARLYDEFAAFQFMLYDDARNEFVAEGHTVPCAWDGTADGLREGDRNHRPSRRSRLLLGAERVGRP